MSEYVQLERHEDRYGDEYYILPAEAHRGNLFSGIPIPFQPGMYVNVLFPDESTEKVMLIKRPPSSSRAWEVAKSEEPSNGKVFFMVGNRGLAHLIEISQVKVRQKDLPLDEGEEHTK